MTPPLLQRASPLGQVEGSKHPLRGRNTRPIDVACQMMHHIRTAAVHDPLDRAVPSETFEGVLGLLITK